MIDPAFTLPLTWFLAGLLTLAASDKILRPREFANAVQGYAILPPDIQQKAMPAIALILILAEVLAAIFLVIPAFSLIGALSAIGIFAAYAFAMAFAILRGRTGVDCGCHFGSGKDALGWPLVVRNIVLIAIAAASALPLTRDAIWLDYISAAFAGGALILILHSARMVQATARHIRILKGAS